MCTSWRFERFTMRGHTVRWFEQHRQEWIADTVRVFGFINRDHLMRKFAISQPQASKDLMRYQRSGYGPMISYNTSAKRYEYNGATRVQN